MAGPKRRAPSTSSPLEAWTAIRTVAVLGGSPASYWTTQLLRNLALARRPPRAFLVHPEPKKVGAVPAVASLEARPFDPELAVLLTPVEAAPELLGRCAAAGARAAVIVGDPTPDAAGRAAVAEIARAAAAHRIAVLGPSSLGFLSPARGAFPFVGRLLEPPPAGRVALVSQSGALAVELVRAPLGGRLGWSHVVSVGVGSAPGAAGLLAALADDPDTDVVGLYLETLEDPPALARAAELALRAGKPVVALRGRVTRQEQAALPVPATRAETALAAGGLDARLAGFLAHHGIVEVPTLEALGETLVLLSHRAPPRGPRVGIVSLSASAGRLCADAFRAAGLEVPLCEPVERRSRARDPAPENPLDLTGRAVQDPREGARRVRAFAADERFDVVVLASQPPRGDAPSDERVQLWTAALADGAGRSRLALPVHAFHGPLPALAADPRPKGNPFLAGLTEAAAAVLAALRVGHARRRLAEPLPVFPEIDVAGIGAWLMGPARTLSEPASLELLQRYGLPVAPWRLCPTPTAAARAARELGGLVAIKAASPDLPGKAAAGLVRLNLDGDAAVRTAFNEVLLRAQAMVPPDRLLGGTVMRMASGTARLVVGVVRDDRLGPLLVARRADRAGAEPRPAVRAAPLRRSQAFELAAELDLGTTASAAIDIEALAETLVRLGRLGADLPALVAAVCLGPLIVAERGRGCAVVDASVVLRPLPGSSTATTG
jgi:acyl-CoA synthetase (NDP forming)